MHNVRMEGVAANTQLHVSICLLHPLFFYWICCVLVHVCIYVLVWMCVVGWGADGAFNQVLAVFQSQFPA